MKREWVNGFRIQVQLMENEAVISANKEGLLSLAKHLAVLAEWAPGDHVHYDESNSLEAGSIPLIIEKKAYDD